MYSICYVFEQHEAAIYQMSAHKEEIFYAARLLVEYAMSGHIMEEEKSIFVLACYFGINNIADEEKKMILLGVYQGLVKCKGVRAELLSQCCLSGRLDELIERKFLHRGSGYYSKYKTMGMSVGITVPHPESFEFPIYDDDHCTGCLSPGYFTQRHGIADVHSDVCSACGTNVCKACILRSFNPSYDGDADWVINREFVCSPCVRRFSLCFECGRPAQSTCARCRAVLYCGRACQKVNWKRHKGTCGDHETKSDTNRGLDANA
jgi:hypothetical protein